MFEGAEIELGVPAQTIEVGQVGLGKLLGIKQGRDGGDDPAANLLGGRVYAHFTQRQGVGKATIAGFVEPIGALGFAPGDDVVVLAEASATAEIGAATLVQTHDDIHAALLQ